MGDIYTGIDLGTDSIKIVVAEKDKDKYHVLYSGCSPSSGIENGFIVDMKSATNCVKDCLNNANEALGIKISKVVACVPPNGCNMDIVEGSVEVEDTNNISGNDVSKVLHDALKNVDFSENELVTAMPINFNIDDDVSVHDPKGMHGNVLNARVVISTTAKESLYRILEVLKLAGVETVDICYSSFGDYYSLEDKRYDELVGAIINIGEESTNVAIFNRGIQIKNGLVPVGSRHVDADLSYALKCNMDTARNIKELFSVAVSSYADISDVLDVDSEGENGVEKKSVNQVTVSKIVEARLKEILNIAKNEIKNLTNREIRYIIITGGISELAGFQYLIEQEFGFTAKVCNIPTMGIRHNKYSSCFGIIKYFNDKLDLRGKHYNMFTEEELDSLINNDSSIDDAVSKVFGHFFDD